MSSKKAQNDLEKLLTEAKQNPSIEPDDFIEKLVVSSVAVILNKPIPTSKNPVLDQGTQFLMVSDGENHNQPMLAMFTDVLRAKEFRQNHPSFPHVVKVHALWPIAALPNNCGIRINPNFNIGFRIDPEQATFLKQQAKEILLNSAQ